MGELNHSRPKGLVGLSWPSEGLGAVVRPPSCGRLGPSSMLSRGRSGQTSGPLGPSGGRVGSFCGTFDALLKCLGAMLEAPCHVFTRRKFEKAKTQKIVKHSMNINTFCFFGLFWRFS